MMAERPTVAELRQRIRVRGAADPGETAAAAVRAERDGREALVAEGAPARRGKAATSGPRKTA